MSPQKKKKYESDSSDSSSDSSSSEDNKRTHKKNSNKHKPSSDGESGKDTSKAKRKKYSESSEDSSDDNTKDRKAQRSDSRKDHGGHHSKQAREKTHKQKERRRSTEASGEERSRREKSDKEKLGKEVRGGSIDRARSRDKYEDSQRDKQVERNRYDTRDRRDDNRDRRDDRRDDRYNKGRDRNGRDRFRKDDKFSRSETYRKDDYRQKRNDNRYRRSSSFDHANAKWGKPEDSQDKMKKEPQEKEKPNFGLSGKLTAETNTYRGVVIKYSEPPEARKPRRRWRLYPFKGEKALQTLYIHRESAYLIGRDRKIVDLPVDHPSCSKQHAALQYRLVPFTRENGSAGKRVRPYLIDLESANGTYINNKKIEPKKYYELIEKDVIKFGFSSREYVLLHENSKDEGLDDDVKLEDEEVEVKKEIKTEN
ncbi:unnamed protein product [Phyllotreta striolata]|uniref:FHA domain-containing protein n=1 Tax=Phyllotreta striolata TaxID=444603 RepID=A0A9N9TQ62_PHYSR|nr:unnamed protein product [Phyllotreta striolata]